MYGERWRVTGRRWGGRKFLPPGSCLGVPSIGAWPADIGWAREECLLTFVDGAAWTSLFEGFCPLPLNTGFPSAQSISFSAYICRPRKWCNIVSLTLNNYIASSIGHSQLSYSSSFSSTFAFATSTYDLPGSRERRLTFDPAGATYNQKTTADLRNLRPTVFLLE